MTFIIDLFHGTHVGVETNLIVDWQNLIFRDKDVGAVVEILGVAVRNYSVQRVIPAS